MTYEEPLRRGDYAGSPESKSPCGRDKVLATDVAALGAGYCRKPRARVEVGLFVPAQLSRVSA